MPARDVPVVAEAEVVVAGGGSAGIAAATASARLGASTIVLERYGFFGGNATSAYVGTICGLYYPDEDQYLPVSGGIAAQWADQLVSRGAAFGPVPFKQTAVLLYVPYAYKRLADEVITSEPDLHPLLHAHLSDAVTEGSEVRAVILATKRGPVAITGKVFIDATGDADLSFFAGAEVVRGKEGQRQYPSMQFLMQNVDFETTRAMALSRLDTDGEAPDVKAMSGAVTGWLSELLATVGQTERWQMERSGGAVFPTFRPGEVLGAMTRISDSDGRAPDMTDLEQATRAEIAGRDQADKAHAFLRENLDGFASSFIADTPTQLGVRETRRVVGDYVLSDADVMTAARFDDAIGAGAWPEEMHWGGTGTEYRWLDQGVYYQLPYRMLLVSGFDNLLAAGRCASADDHASASTRVIGSSMVLGEAAGTAAAMAARRGVSPRKLDPGDIRKALSEAGAII